MPTTSRARRGMRKATIKKRPAFEGFWICRSPYDDDQKEVQPLDSIIMMFFGNRRGNNYMIFLRCQAVFADSDDPVFITYGFAHEYWLIGSVLRRHALLYSKRHTYDDVWRRVDRATFEYRNRRVWERYKPTTLAEIKKRGFDMELIGKFLADARRLGWRYSKTARLPSVSVARPRAKARKRRK